MANKSPTTEQHTPTKYRLPADKAAIIRTAPPACMTVMEAAEYVRISPRKMRDLIQARRVKHARLGKKIILTKQNLDALVAGG